MRLFGLGQVTPDATVRDLLHRVESLERSLRELDVEQTTMHDQVRRWMRRAVAAERRAAEQLELEPGAVHPPAAPLVPAMPPRRLWGARGRRLARAVHSAEGGAATDAGGTDGIPS